MERIAQKADPVIVEYGEEHVQKPYGYQHHATED